MKLNIYETSFEDELSDDLEYLSQDLESEESKRIQEKIESYVSQEQIEQLIFAYKQRKGVLGLIQEEKNRLEKLKLSTEREMDYLRNVISTHLPEKGIKDKVKGISVYWSKSQRVILADEENLSEEYFRVEKKVDLKKLGDDLKNGVYIPEATLQTSHFIVIK